MMNQPTQHQPIYVVRYAPSDFRPIHRCRGALLGLSVGILVLAVTCLVLGIATIGTIADNVLRLPVGIEGTAIWAPIFIIVTGAIGFAGVWHANRCLLIAYLVLTIIGACVVTTLFGMSVFWSIAASTTGYNTGLDEHVQLYESLSVMQGFLAFFAFAELIMAIVASGLLCANLCQCCTPPIPGQIIELPIGQNSSEPITVPAINTGSHPHQPAAGAGPPAYTVHEKNGLEGLAMA